MGFVRLSVEAIDLRKVLCSVLIGIFPGNLSRDEAALTSGQKDGCIWRTC